MVAPEPQLHHHQNPDQLTVVAWVLREEIVDDAVNEGGLNDAALLELA